MRRAAAVNLCLERALDRALEQVTADGAAVAVIDAGTVARVVTRWCGDAAVPVLTKALELAKAGVS